MLWVYAAGTWTVYAGGDGIDSNGNAHMSGGILTVWGPVRGGNGSLDTNNGMMISGGTLFTAGANGMAEAPETSSTQASILVTGSAAKGSVFTITAEDGTQIGSFTLEADGQAFVFSSPDLVAGQRYTISVDGTSVVTATAGEYTSQNMGGGPNDSGRGGSGGARP